MRPILDIHKVSKRYRLNHEIVGYLSFRERIRDLFRHKHQHSEEFWALKDVSFQIEESESIGIIGRNGAGKSTLLKILSRITLPTTGNIACRGRVASLLEVGTGFHPELTGRENIFLNGSLLGMKRHEINRKFGDIVDFSGVERFLDTPLKHFSSGMQLRLAFAVAAFLEPEILIIDEVLAVGDADFQKKCLDRMDLVSKSGRTILFVSHNLAAVKSLCTKAILLENGSVKVMDRTEKVLSQYQSSFDHINDKVWEIRALKENSTGYFKRVKIELMGEQPTHKLKVTCDIVTNKAFKNSFLAFDVSNSIGIPIFQAIPELSPFVQASQQVQTFEVVIELPALIPDKYRLSVWMGPHNSETICWEKEIVSFEIVDSPILGRTYGHFYSNGFLISNSSILK